MSDELCADPECPYSDQPHSHENTRLVIDPDGRTVHLVAVDPWSHGSRQAALRAAVHKFDGFDVREEWDVRERIVATLDAAGYEELFTIVFETAAERGHIHFADDCPRSKDRLRHVRQAKHQADRRSGELAAERDLLASIVTDLAAADVATCGADDLREFCAICHREAPDHTDSCAWVRARAFLASRETQ